ncbi:hypothetical protein [Niveispirillum irakense]|uniref:hypothetical protein n=1 Tax=Niveispirillum irakense TaxID=34011 RepID=UPI0003F9BB6A|nr:hypothetical protein [Niveispirillum irakense]
MYVLYWNIQNITSQRYLEPGIQHVIQSCLNSGAGLPDIIVIVEVYCRSANNINGRIFTTEGTAGLQLIFGWLLAQNPNYACIPPVTVGCFGRCEAVGVIYRSDLFQFLGPHSWSNLGPVPAAIMNLPAANVPWPWYGILWAYQQRKIANPAYPVNLNVANPMFVPEPYPDPWDLYAPFNVAAPLAPTVFYPNPTVPAIPWAALDWGNFYSGFRRFPWEVSRSPLRCTFGDVVNQQVLDLFALHTSPDTAVEALEEVARLPEVAIDDGFSKLIVGDFNVPATGIGDDYDDFRALNYTLAQENNSTFFNTHNPLPYQNPASYRGAGLYIDNMIYRRLVLAPANFYVVDQVQGTLPFWPSQLETPLYNLAGGANYTGNGALGAFQSWANIGHIAVRPAVGNAHMHYGASDHLPLAAAFAYV